MWRRKKAVVSETSYVYSVAYACLRRWKIILSSISDVLQVATLSRNSMV